MCIFSQPKKCSADSVTLLFCESLGFYYRTAISQKNLESVIPRYLNITIINVLVEPDFSTIWKFTLIGDFLEPLLTPKRDSNHRAGINAQLSRKISPPGIIEDDTKLLHCKTIALALLYTTCYTALQ